MKLPRAVSSDCSVINVSALLAAAVPARQTLSPGRGTGQGPLAAPEAAVPEATARCNSPFLVSLPDVCVHTETHTRTCSFSGCYSESKD